MKLKIRQKTFVLLGLNVAAGFLILAISIVCLYAISNRFDQYLDTAAVRQSLLMKMKGNMGFGAGIHDFKNYVLRGKESYYPRINANLSRVLDSIEEYRQLEDLTADEKASLDNIQSVVQAYYDNAQKIRSMVDRGDEPTQVDRVVKIDDTPAVQGFEVLDERYNTLTQSTVSSVATMIEKAISYIVSAIIFTVLLILGAGLLLLRSITNRIFQMSHVVQEIAENLIAHPRADEPTKQQVIVDSLHEQRLQADREQDLQQQRL